MKCGKSRGKRLTNKKNAINKQHTEKMTECQLQGKKLLFEKPIFPLPDVTLVFKMDCLL